MIPLISLSNSLKQLTGFVEDIFVSAVIKHPEINPDSKIAVVRAVNKVKSWFHRDVANTNLEIISRSCGFKMVCGIDLLPQT